MKRSGKRWTASALTGLILVTGLAQAVPAAAPKKPAVAYDSVFGGLTANKTLRIRVTSQDNKTVGYRAKLIDRKGKVLQTVRGTTTSIGTKKKGKNLRGKKGEAAAITFSKTDTNSIYRVEVESF